jgi:hypothetical protein
MDRYLAVVCSTCRNYNGTIKVYDYRLPTMLVANVSAVTINTTTTSNTTTNGTNSTSNSTANTTNALLLQQAIDAMWA